CIRGFDAASPSMRTMPFSPFQECWPSIAPSEGAGKVHRRARRAPPVTGQSAALSGGRGLRSAALRPLLSRIAAGATPAVFGPLRLLAGVRHHLECGASCRRRAPRQHIALKAGIIPTRGLQRTLGDSEFAPLALQTRIELIDAPFGLGSIRAGIDLDFGDAVAQHLYLLLGMGERSLARLERFSETVAALLERGARLLEFTR